MIHKLLSNTQMIWMTFTKNIEDYNPNKKRKILMDDMIADMLSNKKLNSIVFYYENSKQQRSCVQIAFDRSSDIDFQDFMNLYKKCTSKPYSFLVIDPTLAADNSLRFRKNLLEGI